MCDRDNFKTLSGLANHKRLTHKSSNSERDLKKIKSKTINISRRLSKTLSIHAVFDCEICGLICTTRIGLKLHLVKCKKSTQEV